jgi:hypothetical protein
MDYDAWVREQTAQREAEFRQHRERVRAGRAADRDRAPYVYCTLPRCPWCRSVEHEKYGSQDQGDGSRIQYAKCKGCEKKFRIVWE